MLTWFPRWLAWPVVSRSQRMSRPVNVQCDFIAVDTAHNHGRAFNADDGRQILEQSGKQTLKARICCVCEHQR